MSLADIRERERRHTLAMIDGVIEHASRSHPESEQRRAADALGVADHLPSPQEQLNLEDVA